MSNRSMKIKEEIEYKKVQLVELTDSISGLHSRIEKLKQRSKILKKVHKQLENEAYKKTLGTEISIIESECIQLQGGLNRKLDSFACYKEVIELLEKEMNLH